MQTEKHGKSGKFGEMKYLVMFAFSARGSVKGSYPRPQVCSTPGFKLLSSKSGEVICYAVNVDFIPLCTVG